LVAVLAVIIILGALVFGGNKAYEKPIDNMIAVVYKGKFSKIKNMAPKAYWEYMEEEEDFDLDEHIEELEDNADEYEAFLESLEDQYGDKFKIKYKITHVNTVSERKLDTIKDGLKDNYDISKKSVKEAMQLEVKFILKGEDEEEENYSDIVVIKIGNGWYMGTMNGSLIVSGLEVS